MTNFRRICRVIALPLAAVMFIVSVPLGAVQAGMVPTDDVIGAAQAEADRETVIGFLAREEVQAQIQALGVDPAEAERRVAALSEAELRAVADRIDSAPAGQGALGFIVGVVVITLVVVLVLDILGVVDVFGLGPRRA